MNEYIIIYREPLKIPLAAHFQKIFNKTIRLRIISENYFTLTALWCA